AEQADGDRTGQPGTQYGGRERGLQRDADREGAQNASAQEQAASRVAEQPGHFGDLVLGGPPLWRLTVGPELVVTEAVSPSHCFRRYSQGRGHHSRLRTCAEPSS